MKRLLCVLCVLCGSLFAQVRPVHTFSIVARDPQTGQIGVAVQSHWFSVGSIVTWAEAGVGAVATQSFVDPSYGPNGLYLMRNGKSSQDALRALIAADGGRSVRQVAMVDATGNAVSWTGEKDIQAAGGIVGAGPAACVAEKTCPAGTKASLQVCIAYQRSGARDAEDTGGDEAYCGKDFAAQANLMSNNTIWLAMANTYEATKGDLADRLLAALDAAQAAGGDTRGRQSAAILIVEGKRQPAPWMGRIFDLRVDDAARPLKELRRLVALQRAYNHMNAGDLAVEHKDNEAALREYSAAEDIASKTPGVLPSRLAEMIYWHAVALVNMNRVDESLPMFKRAFSIEKGWIELTPRLPKSGLLPDDPKLIERIVAQGK
jgi:uncharacterized Ntn-hydrolase superfamily protein